MVVDAAGKPLVVYHQTGAQLSANRNDDSRSKSQYDGVIVETDSGSFGRTTTTIIALNNTQVKFETDNNGSYDPQKTGYPLFSCRLFRICPR